MKKKQRDVHANRDSSHPISDKHNNLFLAFVKDLEGLALI